MPGNPHDSTWFATPRERRNRKPLSVTLSAEARARLEKLAKAYGLTLSAAVEALVLAPIALVETNLASVTREASDLPSKPRGKELDPVTTAALRAFVKERVKTPAKKKGRGSAKP